MITIHIGPPENDPHNEEKAHKPEPGNQRKITGYIVVFVLILGAILIFLVTVLSAVG